MEHIKITKLASILIDSCRHMTHGTVTKMSERSKWVHKPKKSQKPLV